MAVGSEEEGLGLKVAAEDEQEVVHQSQLQPETYQSAAPYEQRLGGLRGSERQPYRLRPWDQPPVLSSSAPPSWACQQLDQEVQLWERVDQKGSSALLASRLIQAPPLHEQPKKGSPRGYLRARRLPLSRRLHRAKRTQAARQNAPELQHPSSLSG